MQLPIQIFLLLLVNTTAFVPSHVKHPARNKSDLSSRRPRPRPERIPPANPEEVDAARRGDWNYEKGCIEKKDEGIDDLEY
mmetsp:Transcript_16554/g.32917  ORF Transcript_16554/g.32917 Transcript_16554/m.32917 type:complete len:81 (+) Transcript_16554:67-309(+)